MIAYLVPVAILSVIVAYAALTAYGRWLDPRALLDRARPWRSRLAHSLGRRLGRVRRRLASAIGASAGWAARIARARPVAPGRPRPPGTAPASGPAGLPVRPTAAGPEHAPQPNPPAAHARPADRLDQERWRRLGTYFATSAVAPVSGSGRRDRRRPAGRRLRRAVRAGALLRRVGQLTHRPRAWLAGPAPTQSAATPPTPAARAGDGATRVTAAPAGLPVQAGPAQRDPVKPGPARPRAPLRDPVQPGPAQPRAPLPLGPATLPHRNASARRTGPTGTGAAPAGADPADPAGPAATTRGLSESLLADLAEARLHLRAAAEALSAGPAAGGDEHHEDHHRPAGRERTEDPEHSEDRQPHA